MLTKQRHDKLRFSACPPHTTIICKWTHISSINYMYLMWRIKYLIWFETAGQPLAFPLSLASISTNAVTFKCRRICLATFTHNLIIHWVKMATMMMKTRSNTQNQLQNYHKLIQGFTERGIVWRTWNGSTFIVDQNISVDSVLSNPHRYNGVSKSVFCFQILYHVTVTS